MTTYNHFSLNDPPQLHPLFCQIHCALPYYSQFYLTKKTAFGRKIKLNCLQIFNKPRNLLWHYSEKFVLDIIFPIKCALCNGPLTSKTLSNAE